MFGNADFTEPVGAHKNGGGRENFTSVMAAPHKRNETQIVKIACPTGSLSYFMLKLNTVKVTFPLLTA